ncbi:hypothetical protein Acr_13g0015950 [Actinidia rufa]|uniref:Uncharacterized protein n=1 Tax=Actinidia rufa TaxID=165716 RepID=A0A7J0FNA9_9ERIC|nr:hypothetical protein Acr_13g0015950 [Actinidia rufa]
MSRRIDLGKLTKMAKGEGCHAAAEPKKKVAKSNKETSRRTHVVAPGEGTLACSGNILGLNASMLENTTVAEKLLKRWWCSRLPSLKLEKQVAELGIREQQATDELEKLRKLKKEQDANVEGLEKEIVELKKKEVLDKKFTIQEYKSFDDFQEEVKKAASKYFGDGFDLCKKQVGRFHPELNIEDLEIDDELAKEG